MRKIKLFMMLMDCSPYNMIFSNDKVLTVVMSVTLNLETVLLWLGSGDGQHGRLAGCPPSGFYIFNMF